MGAVVRVMRVAARLLPGGNPDVSYSTGGAPPERLHCLGLGTGQLLAILSIS